MPSSLLDGVFDADASTGSSSDLGALEPKIAIGAVASASNSDAQVPEIKFAVWALHTAAGASNYEINNLHFLIFAVSAFLIWVGAKAVCSLFTGMKALAVLLGGGGSCYAVVIGFVSIAIALSSRLELTDLEYN